MTIQKALQNINIVTSNARMTGPEHEALKESILLIAKRCQRADELEKQNEVEKAGKKEVK